MKKLLLTLFLIGFSVANAQSFVCGNGDETPVNNITPRIFL
jgi:hypothetical protein